MRRASAWVLLCLIGGCAHGYVPPERDEPHAIVKFRRVYAYTAGDLLHEQLAADGVVLYDHTVPAGRGEAPLTDAVLVHPRAVQLSAASEFSHREMRMVQESYSVQVPYSATESYSCGTSKSFRTCTRSVTRYRSQTKYRTVPRAVSVSDGECARESAIVPEHGKVYLLELNVQARDVCRLQCYEQLRQPDGSFTQVHCPYAPVQED